MHVCSRFLLIFFLLCAAFSPGFAQITEDFSDGDFTQNPAWTGDAVNFIVNDSGQLQLNAPAAGASLLEVASNFVDSATWRMDVLLAFDPSTTNRLRIYLVADQADLLLAKGYYLEIGVSGTEDSLRFFRQDGPDRTFLAAGPTDLVIDDTVKVSLRVHRSETGLWTIDAASAGGAFQTECTVADATYSGNLSRFFGFHCLYTATRRDKFFFDNLLLPFVPDTLAPVLLSAQADNATQVSAFFNEALDSLSAVDPSHYSISGVGQPAAVALVPGSPGAVRLTLAVPLATGNYELQVNQIADTLGNVGNTQSVDFQFLNIELPTEFDIVFNEVMADPDSTVGLPAVEWVELYNRSGKYIDLQTLSIKEINGLPHTLPAFILAPDSFAVLCPTSGAAALGAVAPNVFGVPGFPSLNNSGDHLILSDLSGNSINQLAYNVDWHTDDTKDDGGWSLERINPDIPCTGRDNWQSCPVSPGGTPGRVNASLQTAPDVTPPRLIGAFPDNATTVQLQFSEGLDLLAADNPDAYRFFPPRLVAAVVFPSSDRSLIQLTLAEPLQSGILYALTVTADLLDCSGNAASVTDTVFIGLPEKPDPQDVVINEILFNPAVGGARYVELYNRSAKIFDLAAFSLISVSGSVDNEPITTARLFLPGEYLVFTEFPGDVAARFAEERADWLFTQDLPSLTDDEDNLKVIWLKNGQLVAVDSLRYSEDWHNALLSSSDREGVALERIRAEEPTNLANNWTSAAPHGGGAAGTPTLPNSQRLSGLAPGGEDLIELPLGRLSPDDDGFEDFLDIQYRMPDVGYAATITIFDSDGLPVKKLVRQELIGTEGSLRWDGEMEDGTRARPGIHILFAEVFAPGGEVRRVKKAFAVVARF